MENTKTKKPKRLKRYTKVENLIRLLQTGELLFSIPTNWDDMNDVELLTEYCKRKNIDKIFVLCFSSEDETIHFWKTFAGEPRGCCINFNVEYLLKLFEENSIIHNKISYYDFKEAEQKANDKSIKTDDIPFIKGKLYRIEEEYRAIHIPKNDISEFKLRVDIKKCIESIVFGYYTKEETTKIIEKLCKEIDPQKKWGNYPTTAYKSDEWIKIYKNLPYDKT